MFKLLEEISGASVSFVLEDVLISAAEGATVAGALLCNGFLRSGAPLSVERSGGHFA